MSSILSQSYVDGVQGYFRVILYNLYIYNLYRDNTGPIYFYLQSLHTDYRSLKGHSLQIVFQLWQIRQRKMRQPH